MSDILFWMLMGFCLCWLVEVALFFVIMGLLKAGRLRGLQAWAERAIDEDTS